MDIERVKMSEKIYYSDEKGKHEAKGEQLDYILSWQEEINQEASLIESEAQAKQAKLESAKAKLTALGLDEEEVAAIVGGI